MIIGGGQAGLATGYHLAQQDRSFVILEANERIGDIWRRRFDSLRLYSPARYDGLPGWGVPLRRADVSDQGRDRRLPRGLRGALRAARHHRRRASTRCASDGERYVVRAGAHRFEADNVVVASGTFQEPIVPEFAARARPGDHPAALDDYRNPAQLQPGPVLVVGASHSGADIALEVAARHPTVLSGRVHGELPFDIEGRAARVVAAGPVVRRRTTC